MFQRITHESWVTIIPMLAFGIMFTVFVVTTIRALRLPAGERNRLAALPLSGPPETSSFQDER